MDACEHQVVKLEKDNSLSPYSPPTYICDPSKRMVIPSLLLPLSPKQLISCNQPTT